MQKNTWSLAAVNGLMLALVTIIITLVQTILEPGSAIKILLWALKLGLSLWLLYYFIKDHSKEQELYTYRDGFIYGFKICLLSSVVCAAYIFLHYTLIFPDAAAESLEQAAAMLQSGNPEALETIERIGGKLPQISTIVTLIYNTLFGLVASAVIANYTKKGDVFSTPA
ncbi:MAG: DUF4199 domain-containing protein [Bacteroidales bacterium]|nr:DUF4199 domain-containing protein [Bacteroidales bacterium]MDD2424768.1 DUF4199 domain-containing protein [Bacteroidales bacterium]MDD3988664.1 DUF4199 domain-containing protein [Bacteroidales bacterium]MDD4638986.1 DUF4199 domain-containing protein [Bacteroidales bacterium]